MTVGCVGLQEPVELQGIPTAPVARVELCSIKALMADIRRGAAADAWLMLLKPTDNGVNRESEPLSGEGVGLDRTSDSARWERFAQEFSDVFEPPGVPAERETKHHIELLPGSVPVHRRQYRVSAAELAEVRR